MSNTRAVDVSIHAVVPVSVPALSAAKSVPDDKIHKNGPQQAAAVIFFTECLHGLISNFKLMSAYIRTVYFFVKWKSPYDRMLTTITAKFTHNQVNILN